MADQVMTPQRAETLGRRWVTAAGVFLAFAVAFTFTGWLDLSALAVTVGLLCAREATEHYAWRRGYLTATRRVHHTARMAGGRRG